MEISVDVRSERRRQLHAGLFYLSDRARNPGYGHGIFGRQSRADQSCPYVPQARKARSEMASLGCGLPNRQYRHHGILLRCYRLDHLLFCEIPHRSNRILRLCFHDRQPCYQRGISVCHGRCCLSHSEPRYSEGSRADHKIYDECSARAHACACGSQRAARRRGRRTCLLPYAGLFQDQWFGYRRRDESGVLHPVHRHGRHGYFRQLHRQGPLADG